MSAKYITYEPNGFYRNGHFNTIYASIGRKFPKPDIKRTRVNTPDNDFLDIDWIKKGNKHLAILGHGLEGSSDSIYMRASSSILSENGFDVLLINQRSCSGEINLAATIYHSGFTSDLDFLIQNFCHDYQKIHLIGFSMGGNIMLKYIGQNSHDLDHRIRSCIAISSPIDLASSSKELSKFQNRIYELNFLRSLKAKIRLKQQQYPEQYPNKLVNKVSSIYQFDDWFTAPIHGFKNADDYYHQSSSLHVLPDIKIPTTIISSLDDPFLGDACYPFEEALNNSNLHLMITQHGGHCGYYTKNSKYSWLEKRILQQVKHFNKKLKKIGPLTNHKRPNIVSTLTAVKKTGYKK